MSGWLVGRHCTEHVGICGRAQVDIANPKPFHQVGSDGLTICHFLPGSKHYFQFQEVTQPIHRVEMYASLAHEIKHPRLHYGLRHAQRTCMFVGIGVLLPRRRRSL